MPGLSVGKALAGKAVYGAVCVVAALVLFVSGVGYYAQQTAESFGTSRVLAGGPSTGAMNILVMGLESRTYWDGTEIDHHLQHILNLGSVGGEQTNTLILVHVFAGGQKAVGFSIPRDDYVTLYGTLGYAGTPKQNKIDDAYNAAFQQELINDVQKHPTWTSAQKSIDANEAGQQATVDTVEALTGVTINKFAELNLIGFYELANAFGGVEACINKWPGGGGVAPGGNLSDPVTFNSVEGQDAGSGFAGRAGLSLLNPVQTLEFVRQRHNLPQGDIDRTQRQQAVIDYVLFQLKNEGMLSDVSKLGSLMSVAKNYMQTSAGWNLLQFAGEMGALTPGNLSMSTLPSTPGSNIPGIGSVNNVDVPTIQRIVQQAFNSQPDGITTPAPTTNAKAGTGSSSKASTSKGSTTKKAPAKPAATTPPASGITVDVYNSSQTPHLASDLSAALVKKGYKAGIAQEYPNPIPLTTVTYGTGAQANAAVIAKAFGLTATPSSTVAAGHVQVILGGSVSFLPTAFGGTAPTATATATPSASSTTQQGDSHTGQATTALEKEAKAKYGIPCVY
jgi:anionic cell wall polymer biosynthesis LytR-Cps2A-Psr (LCP) family protein